MTALPQPKASYLTVADYLALPEDSESRIELQEGNLVMAPRAMPEHQASGFQLGFQLQPSLPTDLWIAPDVDVNLELVPDDQPATVRAPDVAIVQLTAMQRVRRERGMLRASEVVLAVEIISPSSRRTDSVFKHSEYADAGIGHYWVIDLDDGFSLTAYHLGGEFGYVGAEPVKGVFETDTPFPARVDLTRLLPDGER
ncbi:Uma2 family endonuclease [Pseudonocardia lacus]|uniref:Uma2 family endonuclease n=1 Tax=Pseudonocardia lacus TaxID=2835865 RepID=UPI001BDC6657|nr:Uma2 family endonuclease [Pseudonocardia lacus]